MTIVSLHASREAFRTKGRLDDGPSRGSDNFPTIKKGGKTASRRERADCGPKRRAIARLARCGRLGC